MFLSFGVLKMAARLTVGAGQITGDEHQQKAVGASRPGHGGGLLSWPENM